MKPVIFGVSGHELTSDERAFFKDADPLGYILFKRNCGTVAQMKALTDSLRDLSGRADLPILIDQEGGMPFCTSPHAYSTASPRMSTIWSSSRPIAVSGDRPMRR